MKADTKQAEATSAKANSTAADTVPGGTKQKIETGKRFRFIQGDRLVLLIAIVLIFALFSSMNENFLSFINVVNILVAASLVGLVAIGHTFLIIAGENDLSAGSVAGFSGVLAALLVLNGMNFCFALIVTMAVAGLAGYFNAWMVNKIKLESFIATLVTQSVFRGFAYILYGGKAVPVQDATFIMIGRLRILGIPLSVWILIVALAVFGFILAKTRYGRSIYAIGGSREAARLAGLNPTRIILVAYILMGVLCGLGGTVLAARMNSGQPTACVNLEFDSITAVVLGGVSFAGGVGTMGGTVLGIILLQAFNQGLTMVGVPTFWQFVARGALLLFALASDFVRKRRREQKLLEARFHNA